MSPSPLAGVAVVGTNSAGQGVVAGTRNHLAASVAEALAWCDEAGIQVLNRADAEAIVEADRLLAQTRAGAPF